jgi:PilZ domain.
MYNNLLSPEELAMLLEPSRKVRDGEEALSQPQPMELLSSLELPDLLSLLGRADNLVLDAEFKQQRFSFPLSFVADGAGNLLPRLNAPKIEELGQGNPREWRVSVLDDAELFDGNGDRLPWRISNLSASGILLDGCFDSLEMGAAFQALLRYQRHGKIRLRGRVVRKLPQGNGRELCAIELCLKRQAQQKLQQYLYQKHRQLSAD